MSRSTTTTTKYTVETNKKKYIKVKIKINKKKKYFEPVSVACNNVYKVEQEKQGIFYKLLVILYTMDN